MIYYITPYCPEKRLGYIHNQYCSLVPNDDDWICIMDPDTMFLQPDTQRHISDIIGKHGNDWDVLGCMTNRIGVKEQLACAINHRCTVVGYAIEYESIEQSNDTILGLTNISDHEYQSALFHKYYGDSIKETDLVAGFLMLFRKSLWNKIKFQEGINFDIKFCEAIRAQGGKIGIMEGIYVFHLYRWGQDNPKTYKKHLL